MSMISKKEISNCSSLKVISNVLGNLMKKPSLLKEYKITVEDFPEIFQRIIFTAVDNLAKKDIKDIDSIILENYIANYKVQYNTYLQGNGTGFVETIRNISKEDEFEYYYNQLKKYTLLRKIMESGTDVSDYFDPKEINPVIIENKQDFLEKSDISDIMSFYRKKQLNAFGYFLNNEDKDSKKAGVDGLAQKELWKQGVTWGLGYASDYLTSALYGLRQGRFTVGSAGTGVGKTRMTLANLCHAFAPYYYNKIDNQWYQNPNWYEGSGALYIGTEMELLTEIEPIMWAYMANVPENHIKENLYLEGEEERVNLAIEILDKMGNIYCEYVPNYDVGVLENIIENHKISHKINHVFFDYIHSTADLVNEYSSQASNKMALREDQILLNLSTKLKNMARKYNVSIDSWTQVSGDFKNEDNRDQTIVRGAKAIID